MNAVKQHPTLRHSIFKTVLYRIVSWSTTTILAWIIVGHAVEVGAITSSKGVAIFGIVDMIMNTLVYFWYDRMYVLYETIILMKDYHVLKRKKQLYEMLPSICGWCLFLPITFGLVIFITYVLIY